MEAAITVHDLLSIPLYQYLFLANIKDKYWPVNIHIDDYPYVAFHIPGISHV